MFNQTKILVVEDNAFLALDLSTAIEELSGDVVGPTDNVPTALAWLETKKIGAAILNCTIEGQDMAALARTLFRRRIPFVFQVDSELPVHFSLNHPSVPVLRMPLQPRTVLACLAVEIRKLERRASEALDGN